MTENKSEFKSISLKNIIVFSLIIYYMEIILRLNTKGVFFNEGLLYSFLVSIAVSLTIDFVSSFFNKKRKTFLIIMIIFLSYIYISQMIYFNIFKTFYSVYSATKAVKAIGFINDLFYKIATNLHWIGIMIIPTVIYIKSVYKDFSNHRIRWMHRIISLVIAIGLISGINFSLKVKGVENPSSIYINPQLKEPVTAVNKLGLVSNMALDLYKNLLVTQKEEEIPPFADTDIIIDNKKESEIIDNNSEIKQTEIEYNTTEIDFDALIENEDKEILKNMHIYFQNLQPSKKNEFTGKFENYNLIFITAESYSKYSIDKNLTPNLYKLQHEGCNFTNFYNPLWGVSTLDGEYVATVGLLPKTGVWSMYESKDKYLPFAMGNILRKKNYTTKAYHNHYYTYYDRHLSHPNLGYDYKGLGNGLDVKETWPESDLEMMELSIDEYIDKIPFHAYYLTISGHMRYTFGGNYIARKNRDLVQDLPYEEEAKAYMATQIELDRAMGYLLDKLEEKNLLENTIIVMSPDHYPYGMDKENLDALAGHELEENFEIYKSSLIMYNKEMKPMTIDKPVSSLDILPTLLNFMGLDYDSRLLMGRDIFSDSDPLVIFYNRSFITDKGRYNAVTEEFIPVKGVMVEDDHVENILNEIEKKFYYSEQILDNDYYSIIYKNNK